MRNQYIFRSIIFFIWLALLAFPYLIFTIIGEICLKISDFLHKLNIHMEYWSIGQKYSDHKHIRID